MTDDREIRRFDSVRGYRFTTSNDDREEVSVVSRRADPLSSRAEGSRLSTYPDMRSPWFRGVERSDGGGGGRGFFGSHAHRRYVIRKAGNSLIDPPISVEELLRSLSQVEEILSRMEKSPAKSMRKSMGPLRKALVADKLFMHSNDDVRVAVALCISDILRVTAPNTPYDDDQMKVIFELIVSTFENLADKNNRSYGKRLMILEITAKVRSCNVMLDLGCDELIIKMFQHFLKNIRDYHPDFVFSAMETIMTLILKESEKISPKMLSPILATRKRCNGKVFAVSKKLAEQVLKNCTAKIMPVLMEAEKFADVLICEESSGAKKNKEDYEKGGVTERRVKPRKELEDALAKKNEEVESLKQLVDVYLKERDDLQVERNNAVELAGGAFFPLEEPQPPSSFICPISQEIMNDPQVAADGFSYEGENLREWLNSGHETSPMTNLKLSHFSLVPNRALRSAIQEWLQQNK